MMGVSRSIMASVFLYTLAMGSIMFATGFHSPMKTSPLPKLLPQMRPSSVRLESPLHYRYSAIQILSSSSDNAEPRGKQRNMLAVFTSYAPIWTIAAAFGGLARPDVISPTLGALSTVEPVLALLMLAMGLVIEPADISRAFRSPRILLVNALCCFGLMPFLGLLIAKTLALSVQQTVGIVLLGSVSGGQASNLFALLAGGDVALSVICTLSTTLLGVVATPFLVKCLLGSSIAVDGIAVLRSVASLVLVPLLSGLALGRSRSAKKVQPLCPALGVLATLLLVAGGAANSAGFLLSGGNWRGTVAASLLLPVAGGTVALGLAELLEIPETSKRTLVVEVLSKSPTLAYVLARKHFLPGAAAVPAAAMVSLAAVGAVVASLWTTISPSD